MKIGFLVMFLVSACNSNPNVADCRKLAINVNTDRGCVQNVTCDGTNVTYDKHFYMGAPTCTNESILVKKVLDH